MSEASGESKHGTASRAHPTSFGFRAYRRGRRAAGAYRLPRTRSTVDAPERSNGGLGATRQRSLGARLKVAEDSTDSLLPVLTDLLATLGRRARSEDFVTALVDRFEVGIVDWRGQEQIEVIVVLSIVKDALERGFDVLWPERRVNSAGRAVGERKERSGASEAGRERGDDCRTDSHAPNDSGLQRRAKPVRCNAGLGGGPVSTRSPRPSVAPSASRRPLVSAARGGADRRRASRLPAT